MTEKALAPSPAVKSRTKASSLVATNTASSVPVRMRRRSYSFAAMTEKPHCGMMPVAAPSSGARLPRSTLLFRVTAVRRSSSSMSTYIKNKKGKTRKLSHSASKIISQISPTAYLLPMRSPHYSAKGRQTQPFSAAKRTFSTRKGGSSQSEPPRYAVGLPVSVYASAPSERAGRARRPKRPSRAGVSLPSLARISCGVSGTKAAAFSFSGTSS